MMKNSITLSLFLITNLLIAQSIPEGYYEGTTGLSGQELKVLLHQISNNHQVRSYSEFRDIILPDLDEDPQNPDNILLFYKNASIPKSNFASNNEPDFWNREHTWPKSHGFPDESDTAYTDVHNLRPSDATVNTSKSNKDFDDLENSSENAEGEAQDTYTNADFFEPRDEIKGDVARILFYMDMRYESATLDLELVDRKSYSGDPEFGVLYTLIQWHESDPVDQYEIDRHEKAYGYQGNRNPFIDHPEWVAEIWGSSEKPGIVVDQLNFSKDFGLVRSGESFTQQYQVTARNLDAELVISTAAPFELSFDGDSFSSVISYEQEGTTSNLTVYLRFAPTEENGLLYERKVIHSSTGATTFELEVEGEEGTQEITTIAEARSQFLGTVASVTGVVIDAGNNNSDSRVIYDGTAGIVIRSFVPGSESDNLLEGDSVVVSGVLSEYNRLLQIAEEPIRIRLIKQNAALPAPKVVTINEIGENLESQLVTVSDAEFREVGTTFQGGGGDGNFTLTDDTGSIIFRIGLSSHPLVGKEVPEGVYAVTGIVGQFGRDYQLSPRTENDLVYLGDGIVLSVDNDAYLSLYPNPVMDELRITEKNVHILIYDKSGRKLYDKFLDQEKSIDMNDFESGLYLVRIHTETNTRTFKVIKE